MVNSKTNDPKAEAIQEKINAAITKVESKIDSIIDKTKLLAEELEEKYGPNIDKEILEKAMQPILDEFKDATIDYYAKLDEIEQDYEQYFENNKDKVDPETYKMLQNIVEGSLEEAKSIPVKKMVAFDIENTMRKLEQAKEEADQAKEKPDQEQQAPEAQAEGNTPYLSHFNAHASNPEIVACIQEDVKGPDHQENQITPVEEGPEQTMQAAMIS